MIGASGEEMDELELGASFWAGREGGECDEDGCIFVNFCSGHGNQQSALRPAVKRGEAADVFSNLSVSPPRPSTGCS